MVGESKSQLKATGMQSKFVANITLEKLQDFTDDIVRKQKASIRKINFSLTLFTIGIAVINVVNCFLFETNSDHIDGKLGNMYVILMPIIDLFTLSILVISVIRIRRTIKSVKSAFPNDRLIIVHFINLTIWIILASTAIVWNDQAMHLHAANPSTDADKIRLAKKIFWVGVIESV